MCPWLLEAIIVSSIMLYVTLPQIKLNQYSQTQGIRMVEHKVIISAALAGAATTKYQNPSVPDTPEEFADTAAECRKEGASIVHIHARRPDSGAPTPDLEIIGKVLKVIKEKAPDIIINLSTAIGPLIPDKDRIAPVLKFRPEIASLNTNSMNFALGDWTKGTVLTEFIFENTFKTITTFAKTMKEVGTKPEIEVYDFGGMYNVLFLQNGRKPSKYTSISRLSVFPKEEDSVTDV